MGRIKVTSDGVDGMNKKEMMAYCKLILSKPIGYVLDEYEKETIKTLLKNHPEHTLKIKCGIKDIFVGKGLFNSRCFFIKRVDGSETDFSYRSCLSNPKKIDKFKKACRESVYQDIYKFLDDKDNGKTFKCEISGNNLLRKDIHIDHYGEHEFSDIVKMFIAENDINVDEVLFNETMNGCMHTLFKDRILSETFREFHNKYAKLRIIDKKIHMKRHYEQMSLREKSQ